MENNTNRIQSGGFNRKFPVPNEYLELLGLSSGTELSRAEITRRFYQYIHDHHLQSKMVMGSDGVMKIDKRIIIPDAPLREALMLKDGEELNFMNIQKHIGVRYPKNLGPDIAKVTEALGNLKFPAVEEKKQATPEKAKK